jgi:serine/threonine protein kinase
MISLACSDCGRQLEVQSDAAGTRARCPGCGKVIAVPATGQKPAGSSGHANDPTVNFPPPGGAASETIASGPNRAVPEVPTELTEFLAPPQKPDEIGRLGPYRVLAVLGQGGMGVVFRAEDPDLGRPVALKALLPALASTSSARQRFFREARAAAALKHPHVVTIFQVGEDRGAPFLAMELLDGESLDQRIQRNGRLPTPEVLRLGREIAEGLAAAHERGLIHRDIKPANIWLERGHSRKQWEPHVKILDFGLARSQTDPTQLTQSGTVLGTPAYMAPEQAEGKAVDHRCDLFSLGCVLYRMCTGVLPFQGESTLAIMRALALNDPAPACNLRDDVPRPLSDLVMRLLSKDPAARPATAREVADALAELATTVQPMPTQRRSRGLTVALVLLVATLIAVGLVVFLAAP